MSLALLQMTSPSLLVLTAPGNEMKEVALYIAQAAGCKSWHRKGSARMSSLFHTAAACTATVHPPPRAPLRAPPRALRARACAHPRAHCARTPARTLRAPLRAPPRAPPRAPCAHPCAHPARTPARTPRAPLRAPPRALCAHPRAPPRAPGRSLTCSTLQGTERVPLGALGECLRSLTLTVLCRALRECHLVL